MKVSKELFDAMQKWMENIINRPFRESFAAAFPVNEEAEVTMGVNVTVTGAEIVEELLKELTLCKNIKEVRDVLDKVTTKEFVSQAEEAFTKINERVKLLEMANAGLGAENVELIDRAKELENQLKEAGETIQYYINEATKSKDEVTNKDVTGHAEDVATKIHLSGE